MAKATNLKKELESLRDKEKASFLQSYFKTGKGEYGEGDIFYGITVPEQRKIAKRYTGLSLSEIEFLLHSKIHESRLVALLILCKQFRKLKDKKIVDFYLKNTKWINNWDLVDQSASNILGEYLLDKNRKMLFVLAKSDSLWERRIAIISTFAFISNGETDFSFKIAEMLIDDKHDLIQKAVGWMLREAGKRVSQDAEEEFLKRHYKTMPRTMLRYAIERFSVEKKRYYMGKN
jgi:3-methyladenine DNA glycosylase AlkD